MKITAITNKIVQNWLELKTVEGRLKNQQFLVEGDKLVLEALNNQVLESIIFNGELPKKFLKFKNIVEVDAKVLNKLSSLKTPNNIIGVCNFKKTSSTLPSLIVALDGVQDPGNGGNILRSCLGFGVKKVLISQANFDQYNDKFIRATMGAFFKVEIEKVNLKEKLEDLKKLGYKIAITDAKATSEIKAIKTASKLVVVFGSEGQGISKEIIKLSDFKIGIKINPELESLNVGTAAAIILYELTK